MTDGSTGGIYDDMSNAWHIQFVDGGATTLYHAGSAKIATNSGGVTVTGTVTATSFSGSGAGLTNLPAATAQNDIFWENGQTVTTNYTITNGKNAMSAGPITINSGVTVTVGAGETWTVV